MPRVLFIPQPVISHLPGSSQVNFILYRVKGQVIRTFTERTVNSSSNPLSWSVFFFRPLDWDQSAVSGLWTAWKSFERCQVPGIPTMSQHLPHCTKEEGLVKSWQWLQGLVIFCPGPMCTHMSTLTLRPCVIPYHYWRRRHK